jgi:F0F1-type ATP synthase assembly protein I
MDNSKNKPNQSNSASSYARYSGLAFQMLLAIGLGVWGGIKLDQWLDLKFPVFTVVLSLLGVVASLLQLIRGLPK